MKRIFSLLLLLSLLATLSLGLSGCGQETDYLYIYNWGEYMPLGGDDSIDVPELFEQYYEEVTGRRLEVVYSIFASNEEMYAKLKNGASKIDLIIPSDYMVERLIAERRLAKLDFDNIPNIGHISDKFLDYAVVNIRLQKSHADLAHHVLDVALAYAGLAAHLGSYILKLLR